MSATSMLWAIAMATAAVSVLARRTPLGGAASAVGGTASGVAMLVTALVAGAANPLARVALLGIGAVSVIAFAGGGQYYRRKTGDGGYGHADVGLIGAASVIFVTLLASAALADNVVVAWMLIEATTVLGVYLIAVGRHAHSVEAAWKFAVLGFTGVGFGLAGLGIIEAGAKAAGLPAPTSFAALSATVPQIAPIAAAMGFGLVFVGFGTKGGLFPFHWWLPDAHSQTPTPVSSLMSGALVPTALVLLARMALAMPGPAHSLRPVLIAAGLGGLVISVLSIAYQRDAKRLLAYSTVEHMALMTLALAIGTPLALAAFAIHLLGHAIAKGAAFMGVGGLVEAAGSREVDRLAGSFSRAPLCASLLLVSGASLVGFPVGPIFVSEILLVLAAAQSGLWWLALVVGFLLVLAAAAFSERIVRMLMGASHASGTALGIGFAGVPAAAVAIGTVVLLWRPEAVAGLVRATAALVGAGV